MDNPLTTFGVEYVLKSIREQLQAGTDPDDEPLRLAGNGFRGWRHAKGYYAGQDCNAMLRDWAEEVLTYLDDERDKRNVRTVELFLYWTRPGCEEHEDCKANRALGRACLETKVA